MSYSHSDPSSNVFQTLDSNSVQQEIMLRIYNYVRWCIIYMLTLYVVECVSEVQRPFAKHISGMNDMDKKVSLSTLGLYYLQHRRERYLFENKVSNLSAYH